MVSIYMEIYNRADPVCFQSSNKLPSADLLTVIYIEQPFVTHKSICKLSVKFLADRMLPLALPCFKAAIKVNLLLRSAALVVGLFVNIRRPLLK